MAYTIRLFGIDTPERCQICRNEAGACYHCGDAATARLKELTRDKSVTCKPTGTVTYGRMVAVCEADGVDLAEVILKEGLIVAYRRFLDEVPDRKPVYLAAKRKAREVRRGLSAGEFLPPERWRREERLEGCE